MRPGARLGRAGASARPSPTRLSEQGLPALSGPATPLSYYKAGDHMAEAGDHMVGWGSHREAGDHMTRLGIMTRLGTVNYKVALKALAAAAGCFSRV